MYSNFMCKTESQVELSRKPILLTRLTHIQFDIRRIILGLKLSIENNTKSYMADSFH